MKRPLRKIKVAGQETASERQQRTAVRFIMDNPHYQTILKFIRSGQPNGKIAEWAIIRGVVDVNQKTMVSYLQYFRKAQPRLCKPQNLPGEENMTAPYDYDHLFDGNSLVIDEETELVRLISLQKARLGIGFRNEREINMLLQSNRREVEELRNLLIDLAKLRGHIKVGGDVIIHNGESVKDDLKSIQQDEKSRNMIATLVGDLVGVMK